MFHSYPRLLNRTQRYTINLSKSSFGLLLGWLSDIGLEALWDVPKDTGRYKEAIRHIVNTRLNVRGESGLSSLEGRL